MTPPKLRVSSRNALFQQWQALLTNRTKRSQIGSFVVQGVRPISLAVEHGWAVEYLVAAAGRAPSAWAREIQAAAGGTHVEMAPELLQELSEKSDEAPELLAVVRLPPDDLARVLIGPNFLGVAFDRPSSPGNIGTLIRSADAFGAAGVYVTGRAADPYDPKSVRASTGSLLALPVVRADSADAVLEVVGRARQQLPDLTVVGTDESGDCDVDACDWRRPTLLVIGNETTGMSRAWREAADVTVRIPMTGAASSLNASSAATVALYEAHRSRRLAEASLAGRSVTPEPPPASP